MAGISNKERAKRRLDDIKAEKAEIGTFAAFRMGLLTEELALKKEITDEEKFGLKITREKLDNAKKLVEAQ